VGERLQRGGCNRLWVGGIYLPKQPTFRVTQEAPTMDLGILIPISLFVCIAYSIKVCVDAMVRRRMVDAVGSPDLIDSVLRDERLRRRHSALRWGVVPSFLSLGFGLIQWFGWSWNDNTPGVIAVLAGTTGLGNLVFFLVARRIT
jgi:hypothetical protein